MRLKKNIIAMFSIVLIFQNTSCDSSVRGTALPSEITKEIEGEYKFIFKTGQVEVLKINLNSTYSKVIYSDTIAYKMKTDTLFSNEGQWTSNGDRIGFQSWLWCNDPANKNSLINKPYIVGLHDVSWRNSENVCSILISDEPFYQFFKVK